MKKYLYSFFLLMAAAIWGFGFSAQSQASVIPSFVIGALRYAIGAMFLFLAIPMLDAITKSGRRLISKRWLDLTRTELIGGALCGAVLTAASAFQQSGLAEGASAGKASFITALYVVLVPIASLLFGKRSSVTVWCSVGIAVVGFYLLCIKEDFSIVFSDLLLLICAFIYMLHIIVIDRYSPRCDGVRMSCVQFATAAVLNALLALITGVETDITLIGENLLPLLYLGIGSTGIAYTLQVVGQRGAHPAVASIIMSLESVFGMLGGALLLGERLTVREYIGCAIVFVAVILSQVDIKALRRAGKRS